MTKYPIPPKNPFGPRKPDSILAGICMWAALIGYCLLVMSLTDPSSVKRQAATGLYEVNGVTLVPSDDDVRWLLADPSGRSDAFDATYGDGQAKINILWGAEEGLLRSN